MPHQVYKFESVVQSGGKLELNVPVVEGSQGEVLVITSGPDECKDLLEASVSNTEFWDNPIDDAEWNHV